LIEFKVSKSTYYRFLKSNPNKDYEDYKLIEKLFIKHKQKIGIRGIKMHLERDYKIIMNHKKIARIKNKYALVTKIRGKNKYKMMHKKKFEHVIFPNILNRKFKQTEADKVYSTDITQIHYNGKRAYLASVKDLCTKEIVGKSI
jgi:transposase InsO family protein